MKTFIILCLLLAVTSGQLNSEPSTETSSTASRPNGGAGKVKGKEAAGHDGDFHEEEFFDSSTCSTEASYVLALNGNRYFCRDTASTDFDSCTACCAAASRTGTKGKIETKDVSGFLASNIINGRRICVCCIPNNFDQ